MSETQSSTTPVAYKPIPGFPFFRAGDDGSIWSCMPLARSSHGRWHKLRPFPHKLRPHYLRVTIRESPKAKPIQRQVHNLVMLAFVGEPPQGQEVRHLDGNAHNNQFKNLTYGTRLENAADVDRHGTRKIGSQRSQAKLTEADIPAIRDLVASGMSQVQVAKRFGVHAKTISRVLRRTHWRHVPVDRAEGRGPSCHGTPYWD